VNGSEIYRPDRIGDLLEADVLPPRRWLTNTFRLFHRMVESWETRRTSKWAGYSSGSARSPVDFETQAA
jgi:hypothetical protein